MATYEDVMARLDAEERERQRLLDEEIEKQTYSVPDEPALSEAAYHRMMRVPVYEQVAKQYPDIDKTDFRAIRKRLHELLRDREGTLDLNTQNQILEDYKDWFAEQKTKEITSSQPTNILDVDTYVHSDPFAAIDAEARTSKTAPDWLEPGEFPSDDSEISAKSKGSILRNLQRVSVRRALQPSKMEELNQRLTEKIDKLIPTQKKDATVKQIHPFILFYRNSVNVVIGRRGSGKTYNTLREILKLPELDPENNYMYTQIFYVSDKAMDDTVSLLKPLFPPTLKFIWMQTDKALNLLNDLGALKAKIADPKQEIPADLRSFYKIKDSVEDARKLLNAEHLPDRVIPHTIVMFDDCLSLFSKTTPLAKKLYENRQIRTTVFMLLQDVSGLSPSMKSNTNALQLFGGYSRQKFNVLFYQLPPVETQYDDYKQLGVSDSYFFNFENNEEIKLVRHLSEKQASMKHSRDRRALFSD